MPGTTATRSPGNPRARLSICHETVLRGERDCNVHNDASRWHASLDRTDCRLRDTSPQQRQTLPLCCVGFVHRIPHQYLDRMYSAPLGPCFVDSGCLRSENHSRSLSCSPHNTPSCRNRPLASHRYVAVEFTLSRQSS